MTEGGKEQGTKQEITTSDEALRQIDSWYKDVYSEKGNGLQRDGFLASKTVVQQRISDKGYHGLTPVEEGWKRWIAGERPPAEGEKTN